MNDGVTNLYDFFQRRVTYFRDPYNKCHVFTGQRVIGINRDLITVDMRHSKVQHFTAVTLCI